MRNLPLRRRQSTFTTSLDNAENTAICNANDSHQPHCGHLALRLRCDRCQYDGAHSICIGNCFKPRVVFTGKERDAESGNDYFGARYFASSMGRWLSPDWSARYEPVPYAKLDDPQTLNLYAYVGNNPLTRADADGHVAPGGTGGCTGTKCSNGKSDGSAGKQIQQTIKDHPVATAVVVAVAQTTLAVLTDGGSVAVEAAVDTIETESVEMTATISEETATTAEGSSSARFVADDKGTIVDTESTPAGSYKQPGGGRTDILQKGDHGAGFSHTHDPIVNTNPRTGESFVNGLQKPGRPVSAQDVENIQSGAAPQRTDPLGR